MALFKSPGLEVEFRRRAFFAEIRGLVEVWIELNSGLRGLWWADYTIEDRSLLLFFGGTYIAICPTWKRLSTRPV